VRQIISSLKELGVPVRATDAPRRVGDPAFLVADSSKAKAILNWQPQYTRIEDILKTAFHWHQQHG
jgi:UDP-glucose 4-epimerase